MTEPAQLGSAEAAPDCTTSVLMIVEIGIYQVAPTLVHFLM